MKEPNFLTDSQYSKKWDDCATIDFKLLWETINGTDI